MELTAGLFEMDCNVTGTSTGEELGLTSRALFEAYDVVPFTH